MDVIDTNAFYYAAEISEFTYSKEKLQEFIRTHEIIISTTSLFEFLIKHRNKIDIVQKGGEYLYQNNIKIASNVINPLPEHFVDDLANISQESLDVLCAEILENKIDVESRFTSVLFDYSHLTEQLLQKFKKQRSTEFLHRLSVAYWKHNNDPELRKHTLYSSV